MAPAVRCARVLLVVLAVASTIASVNAGRGRRLLAAQVHTFDWRTSAGNEISVNYGDTLKFKWAEGPRTGVVQLAPPGLCVAGKAWKPPAWKGLTMNGNRTPSKKGTVKVKFTSAGSYFFTSPLAGECDAHWLRVNVLSPAYSGPYTGK